MIVTDTNLVAYLYIEGDRTTQAEQALHKDPAWAAPLLWRSEFRNVLALYLRQAVFSLAEATVIMQTAESLLRGREYEVSSQRVLDLVGASRCSAYDCEFVVLAQDLGTSLVTADQRILADFPNTAIPLDVFAT